MSPTLNNYYNNLLQSNFNEHKNKFYETPQKYSNFPADKIWNDSFILNGDHYLYESPLYTRNLSKYFPQILKFF